MPLGILGLLAGLGQGLEEGKDRELKRKKEAMKLAAEEKQSMIDNLLWSNLLERMNPQGQGKPSPQAITQVPQSITGMPALDAPGMGMTATPPQMPSGQAFFADIAKRAANRDPQAIQDAMILEKRGYKIGPAVDIYQKGKEEERKQSEFEFQKAKGRRTEKYTGPTGSYERLVDPQTEQPIVIPGQTDQMGWKKVAEPEITATERGPYMEKRDKYGNLVGREDKGFEEPVYQNNPATGAREVVPKFIKTDGSSSPAMPGATQKTAAPTEGKQTNKDIKPMAGEQAGKFSATINGIDNVQKVRERLLKDGKVDKRLVAEMTMWLGDPVPGTEGETYGRMMMDALEAQIRTESGAAIPDEEVRRNAKRHYANILSSPDAVATGLNMLENKLQGTKRALDPSGEYEKTVKEVQTQPKGKGSAGGKQESIDSLPSSDKVYVNQIQKMIDKGVVTLDTLTPNQQKFRKYLRQKK